MEAAELFHVCWDRKKVKLYWRMSHSVLQRMIGWNAPFKPSLFLPSDLKAIGLGKVNVLQWHLLIHLIVSAGRILAKNWQSAEILLKEDWFSGKTDFVMLMDKLSAIIRYRNGNVDAIMRFQKQWNLSLNPWKLVSLLQYVLNKYWNYCHYYYYCNINVWKNNNTNIQNKLGWSKSASNQQGTCCDLKAVTWHKRSSLVRWLL